MSTGESRSVTIRSLLCNMPTSQERAATREAFAGWPRTLLCGVLAGACVLAAGTLLGARVRHDGDKQVQRAMAQAQTAQRVLSTGELIRLFAHYSFAFADAAIDFQDVPKFNAQLVYAVAASLPDDVMIESMVYSGRDLLLNGTAQSDQSISMLCVNLLLDERVARAVQLAEPKITAKAGESTAESGGITFSVLCTPAVEQH